MGVMCDGRNCVCVMEGDCVYVCENECGGVRFASLQIKKKTHTRKTCKKIHLLGEAHCVLLQPAGRVVGAIPRRCVVAAVVVLIDYIPPHAPPTANQTTAENKTTPPSSPLSSPTTKPHTHSPPPSFSTTQSHTNQIPQHPLPPTQARASTLRCAARTASASARCSSTPCPSPTKVSQRRRV